MVAVTRYATVAGTAYAHGVGNWAGDIVVVPGCRSLRSGGTRWCPSWSPKRGGDSENWYDVIDTVRRAPVWVTSSVVVGSRMPSTAGCSRGAGTWSTVGANRSRMTVVRGSVGEVSRWAAVHVSVAATGSPEAAGDRPSGADTSS